MTTIAADPHSQQRRLVLAALGLGLSVKEIAAHLHISRQTVWRRKREIEALQARALRQHDRRKAQEP